MKAFKVVALLLVTASLFTGCDFVRSILGKPTSADIERMRVEEEAAQVKKQRQLDSITKANEEAIRLAEAEQLKNRLDKRFYVILGSFKVSDNASKMFTLLEKKGFTPRTIKFKNGFEVVAAGGYDTYGQALHKLDEIRDFEYCPDDIWIYSPEQKEHEE